MSCYALVSLSLRLPKLFSVACLHPNVAKHHVHSWTFPFFSAVWCRASLFWMLICVHDFIESWKSPITSGSNYLLFLNVIVSHACSVVYVPWAFFVCGGRDVLVDHYVLYIVVLLVFIWNGGSISASVWNSILASVSSCIVHNEMNSLCTSLWKTWLKPVMRTVVVLYFCMQSC